MSYDEMKDLWRSPVNRPSATETEVLRELLVTTLRREQRGFRLRLGIAMVLLLVPVGQLAWLSATGGAFAFAREWAAVLLLVLPWIAAVMFLRRHFAHRRAHAGFEESVSRALRAVLDANKAAQQRARIVQWLLGACAPIVAVSIWQLQVVGKARPHEAMSMAVVMALLIGGAMGGMYWKIRQLRPEERRLAAMVAELG